MTKLLCTVKNLSDRICFLPIYCNDRNGTVFPMDCVLCGDVDRIDGYDTIEL